MKTCQWDEIAEALDPGGGDDAPPRRIVIWFGPHYRESWIERLGESSGLSLHVRCDRGTDPLDYLTPEMMRMIRPEDTVAIFGMIDNGRDRHLQTNLPPWKRRPWRSAGPGQFEIETSPGTWEPMEVAG